MSKILLVEDDNNLREIYEARLQAEGYEIVSARDGEEALVVAKAEKPDLVISDIMMPKISGFEMLDILRNTEGLKDVKVVMLTALGQSDDQQRADKLGADRYLVKSQVTLEDIVKAAHDLLQDDPVPANVEQAAADPPKPPAAAPPPPPKPAPTTPAPAAPPATPPLPKPQNDVPKVVTKDEKLMTDAVNSLVADTEKKSGADKETAKSGGPSAKISATATATDIDDKSDGLPSDDTPAGAAPGDTESKKEDKKEDEDPDSDHVPVARKKVIKPLGTKPGKDIQTLLAEEEAKEAGETVPSADSSSDSSPPASPAAATTAAEEAAMDAKIEDFVAGASTEPTPPTPPPAPAAPPPPPPATPPPPKPAPTTPAPPANQKPVPSQAPKPDTQAKPSEPPKDSSPPAADPNIISL